MSVLVRGGTVVNADRSFRADVYCEDGVIKAVGDGLVVPGGAEVVDAGGAWQRGEARSSAVIRVTPGVGLRIGTPLGPARLDVAYNPYKLQSGPLFQVDAQGNLEPVPDQPSYTLDRKGRLTYHIAVGQAF